MYFSTCQKENWEKRMWYLKYSVISKNSERSRFQKERWNGGQAMLKNPFLWIGQDLTGLLKNIMVIENRVINLKQALKSECEGMEEKIQLNFWLSKTLGYPYCSRLLSNVALLITFFRNIRLANIPFKMNNQLSDKRFAQ
jgi:hypothetical protein